MEEGKTLPEKTFEEWLEEALYKIPLYTGQWTNYNPSEPGMAILETFLALGILQQEKAVQVTPEAVEKLLKLTGIIRKKGSCARVLLAAENLKNTVTLPANQRFRAGGLIFETQEQRQLTPGKIIAVYGERENRLWDFSGMLEAKVPLGTAVFGENPEVGNRLYFVMNNMPREKKLYLYGETTENPWRNPFCEGANPHFASVSWEYYTDTGFRKLSCQDKTAAFLQDGELLFSWNQEPALYEGLPVKGYCIRGTLQKAEYDMPPSLVSIKGFLFEAWQKETCCAVHSFRKKRKLCIPCNFMEESYVQIFCREEEGKFYRKYEKAYREGLKGRYYFAEKENKGRLTVRFDQKSFGYGPSDKKDAVRAVVYNEDMMRQYELGKVFGYDNQEITLPVQNIMEKDFCILAKRTDEEQIPYYDFVKPGRTGRGELWYELLGGEGKIRILDSGDFIDADLYLAGLSAYAGDEGNIRKGNTFLAEQTEEELVCTNPSPGTGGCREESLEEMKERFYAEYQKPCTVVTEKDYEVMMKEIAGLCIHKVHVTADTAKNQVTVVVKPYSTQPFPKLSHLYQQVIERYLENRRMLSCKVTLAQPVYTRIHVKGIIQVKPHYENSREKIVILIQNYLDRVHGPGEFGELIEFEELFTAIENLDCVESVQSLALFPENRQYARLVGMDIKPREDCLCCPGKIELDISTARLGEY